MRFLLRFLSRKTRIFHVQLTIESQKAVFTILRPRNGGYSQHQSKSTKIQRSLLRNFESRDTIHPSNGRAQKSRFAMASSESWSVSHL